MTPSPIQFGFPQPSIRCSLNGSELEGDAKSLSSLNVKPYDLIIVRRVMQQQPQQRPPALPQPQQQHQPPLAAGRRNPLDSSVLFLSLSLSLRWVLIVTFKGYRRIPSSFGNNCCAIRAP